MTFRSSATVGRFVSQASRVYEAAGQSHFTGRTSGPTGTSSNVGQGSVSAGLTVPVLYVERNMDRENAAGAMLGVLCYLLLSGGPIESKVDAISLALAVIIGVTGREIADLVAEGARAGFRIAPQGLRITALEITAAFTDPMPAFGATPLLGEEQFLPGAVHYVWWMEGYFYGSERGMVGLFFLPPNVLLCEKPRAKPALLWEIAHITEVCPSQHVTRRRPLGRRWRRLSCHERAPRCREAVSGSIGKAPTICTEVLSRLCC